MLKILTAPSRYIQGYDVIKEAGKHISKLGSKPFIMGGNRALLTIKDKISASMKENSLEFLITPFNGKGTRADAENLATLAMDFKADVIIGAGGGLAIDTAKAIAHETGLPLTIIPTIASTDAPCSSASLQYTEDHRIDRVLFMKRNPDLVIVDTRIIAEAPTRFFVAGMGDALSTWFEAHTCQGTGARNLAGGMPTATGIAIARLTYDTLMKYGVSAKKAVDQNAATPAVEMVIEANCLLSSMGFENCGLGAAHSFGVGLSALEGTEDRLHGELVGFGVIANLVIENYSAEETHRVIEFCASVGLPVTLKELGIEYRSRDNIMKAARASYGGEGTHMTNLAFDVTHEMIVDSIIMADKIGEEHLKKSTV
jgi:glycerol dehydrogenase